MKHSRREVLTPFFELRACDLAKELSNFSEIFDITWIFDDKMKAVALKSHLNMYLIGKNLTGKNFRRQKFSSAKNFVTLKIFVTFYRAASFILLFRECNFGKNFRRQKFPSAIIFVTGPKFRHFLPVKFLPIRYLYGVPTVSTPFAYKRLATPD